MQPRSGRFYTGEDEHMGIIAQAAGLNDSATSWFQSVVSHPVTHIVLLFALLLVSKAVEHIAPRQFFQGIAILRKSDKWNPFVRIDQWRSEYVTDDPAPVISKASGKNYKRELSQEEIAELYSRFSYLAAPTRNNVPLTLYGVSETFEIMLFGKYRVGWSIDSPTPRRMRLWGRFDPELRLATGSWDDHESGTHFRGNFVIAFDHSIKVGLGIWSGTSETEKATLRTYPWSWYKQKS